MLYSEDELRRVIQGQPVGDVWPYRGGEYVEIEDFLWQVVEDIARCPTLEVYTGFERDDGTADYHSFLDVFYMPPKQWEEHPRSSEHVIIRGFRLNLCRQAPVAVFGASHLAREKAYGMISYTLLTLEEVGTWPEGDWTFEEQWLRTILEHHNLLVPNRRQLAQPLPFKAEFSTFPDKPRVFDALFHDLD